MKLNDNSSSSPHDSESAEEEDHEVNQDEPSLSLPPEDGCRPLSKLSSHLLIGQRAFASY